MRFFVKDSVLKEEEKKLNTRIKHLSRRAKTLRRLTKDKLKDLRDAKSDFKFYNTCKKTAIKKEEEARKHANTLWAEGERLSHSIEKLKKKRDIVFETFNNSLQGLESLKNLIKED
jgi:galactokinase